MVSSSGEQVASRGFTDMYRRFLDIGARLDFPDMTFATILLAMRSIFWPYLGLVHDARLYAFQAFNHSQSGKFGQDLFFAFGSQDNYSVFSPLMSPLVSWFGLKAAFWVVYMLASALLIYAEVRLVRRLVPDRSLANLGLLALTVMGLPYGGWSIFHVHETFLTARLPAQGLALLGIEATLQRRWLKALTLIFSGMALHPLMALGAMAVLVAVFSWHHLRSRRLVGYMLFTLGTVVLLALMNWKPLNSFLGVMDQSWIAAVKKVSWHCFLSRWRILDWYWLIGSLALLLWGCRWLEPERRTVIYALFFVCIGGLITTAMGELLRSPLLLQGQGYRSLWMSEVFAVPLGLLVADRLSQSATVYGRWAVLGIIAFLGNPFILNTGVAPVAPLLLGIFLLLSAFWAYLSHKKLLANRADAIWQGLFAGMLSAAVILSFLVVISAARLSVTEKMDPIGLFYATAVSSSPLALLVTAIIVLWTFSCVIRDRKRIPVFAASVWVFLSLATMILQENPTWRQHFQPGYRDLEFIASFLDDNSRDKADFGKAQIYWPVDSTLIWFDLQMNCYYNLSQFAGIIFSKETAAEGIRRAALVRFFEVAQMRVDRIPQNLPSIRMRLELSGATFQDRPPNREDLLRLAADERLDWIVLNERFDGLYSATNGSVFIYDCGLIRSSEGK